MIFQKIWQNKKEFLKYSIIGFSSFILDISSLIFLKEIFLLSATLAVIINQIFIIFYNFNLNKFWTFKNKSKDKKQFVKYLILMLFNYCFSIIFTYFFSDFLNFDYKIIRILNVCLMVSWNFILYKFWVYKRN